MKTIIFSLMCFSSITSLAAAGDSSSFQRIVGGKEAVADDAPFIVSLRKYGQHYCGGSLVGESWVVTAAHCIDGMGKPDDVLVGSLTVGGSKGSQKFKVDKVFVHPNYNVNIQTGSDFAILKLKGKVVGSFAVLNTEAVDKLTTQNFSVAGWGVLDESGYSSPKNLQILDVPFVDQKTCEDQLQKVEPASTPYLDSSMFCAGFKDGGKDACQGDSGGPIFFKNEALDKFILVGVVSWGYGCARKDLSGIYSNISSENTWFSDIMTKN